AGRPEACFFIERAVDLMARKISIDPIEFRRRNAIQPGEFPYDNGAGFTYDGGNFPLLLDMLVNSSDYSGLLKSRSSAYKKFRQGEACVAGIGVCLEVEDTGAQLNETARIVLEKSGSVKIYTGSSPHGQGLETTLAQLCSEELGLPLDRVTVLWGDTALIPFGVGTFGSRSAATGGSSVVEAARKLKLELITNASKLLGENPKLLEIKNGGIVKSSEPDHVLLTLSSILEKLNLDEISAASDYKLGSLTFASGAHLCALKLDTETGKLGITKYVAVDDCGIVINEAIVDGQIHGGVVHGIGGSILEQLVYDEEAHLLSSNFLDYTIPSSLDSPNMEIFHLETPSTIALNGAKGVGESGTIAAYPAVINALNDAISQVVPGVELNSAPATPEVVLSVLKRRQSD
ncbi:MAG: xanthine dehydrogenase family protein molybdopterin-binding subunit, partial [Nitrososphaerales archaeon]